MRAFQDDDHTRHVIGCTSSDGVSILPERDTTLLPLEALGRRIVILGPTNAGKSTLAVAIGHRLGIEVIHLDQLRHLPNTDWQQRSDAEFHALHDAAIERSSWIMDGNYSVLMPERLARATGIIVLDDTLGVRFRRYLVRTTLRKQRAGALEGRKDSIKFEMIAWLWKTRASAEKLRKMASATTLPTVIVRNAPELDAVYRSWVLAKPDASGQTDAEKG
jgi:adenylate kinase family enzyme